MQQVEKECANNAVQHPARGTHLLLTLRECDLTVLNDEATLKRLVGEAATATGAKVLQVVSHRFHPQGVTVIAVLAESHASLHTYPESAVVFWDCFTCGDTCQPELSIDVLRKELRPGAIEQHVIAR